MIQPSHLFHYPEEPDQSLRPFHGNPALLEVYGNRNMALRQHRPGQISRPKRIGGARCQAQSIEPPSLEPLSP